MFSYSVKKNSIITDYSSVAKNLIMPRVCTSNSAQVNYSIINSELLSSITHELWLAGYLCVTSNSAATPRNTVWTFEHVFAVRIVNEWNFLMGTRYHSQLGGEIMT